MTQTILFPTDFSGRCDRARDRAAQLARQWRAHLVLFHVAPTLDPAAVDPVMAAADHAASEALLHERLRAEITEPGISIETRLGAGEVAAAIVEAAQACGADMIVTGVSRRDEIGDYWVGTTVERVIRHAGAPVLVVKDRGEGDYTRIMVATDFSDCSGAALRMAMALFPEAEITLVHAYHVRLEGLRGREGPAAALQAEIALDLDRFLEALDLPDAARDRLEINVDYGDVSQVASDHVKYSQTDLAVIGTHGRTAAAAAVLGGKARALVASLDCDVLLVRGDARAAPSAG